MASLHTTISSLPFGEDDLLLLNTQREVVTCSPNVTIRYAAALMSKRNVGSIIIADTRRHPVGIVTDTDLRRKVVAGVLSPDHPIDVVMSAPVITVAKSISVANAILKMMRYKVRHLCVTEDGTPNSAICGIVSEHDVLLMHGNNPAVLVKEILQCNEVEQLARIRERGEGLVHQYIIQNMSLHFIADIISEVNDALVGRLILLAEERLVAEGFDAPPLAFCWLSFGSEGRREQFLRTDQDNALVYEDPKPEDQAQAAAYFQRLAHEVCGNLVTCGFELCPGNNMASNSLWCQPLSTWKQYFREWIHIPNEGALLNAAIFFDFRPVFGEASLAYLLRQYIQHDLSVERRAIVLLAKNAARNPDGISVLGKFITERKGEHKGQFDVKLRAAKPITDAARVLALDLDFHSITSTSERLQKSIEVDSVNAEVYREAVMAFELFMRHRVLQGLRSADSGRFINLSALSRIEKESLRSAIIATENLLSLIRVRYQLQTLGLT
jgi:CBS domain-containing protein